MLVFKRNQIVILSLVLMVVIAGYLQYNYQDESVITRESENSSKIGEAVYVDSKKIETDNYSDDTNNSNGTNTTSTIIRSNDFFAQAKLDKQKTREKDKDALKELSDNAAASKEAKTKVYEEYTKLVSNSEKEMKIETLVKEKGFANVIALFADDGSLDVVVEAPNLSFVQTAQIADIASRHANIKINNVHVKNTY